MPVLLTGVGIGVVSVEMGNGLIGALGVGVLGVLVELLAVALTVEVRCAGLFEAILFSSVLNAWVLVFLAGAWLTGWLAIE
ncbi:MAG: hypothetical protein P4L56_22665 [Candidatus Sulfopaludibacter sp.]|nr:hypothetical protein [Candidatus Sulfopaludibacter sp.]